MVGQFLAKNPVILGELRSLLDDVVFFLRSKKEPQPEVSKSRPGSYKIWSFGSIIDSGSRVTTSGSIFGGSNMMQLW